MAIQLNTIYTTDDGKRHETYEDALHWERRCEAHADLEKFPDLTSVDVGVVCNFFDIFDAYEPGLIKAPALASYMRTLADKLDEVKQEA